MAGLFCEQIDHQVPKALLVDGKKDAGPLSAGGSLFAITEASPVIQSVIRIDIDPPSLLFCNILEGFPFYDIPVTYLKKLKERRISFYVLHIPLDRNGPYSTSMNLAKALHLPVAGEFCEYLGCKVGVICETDFTQLAEFALHVEKVIGHDIKVRRYGDEIIENGTIAVAAGGGCIDFVARELAVLGINTYLTGLTKPMPSFGQGMEFHRIAKENKINLVGATHYSTEKFACIAMVDYFGKLGMEAEFVEGMPCLEDL